MVTRFQRLCVAVTLCVSLVVLDQFSKYWVQGWLASSNGHPISLTMFLDIVLVRNQGIAYGLFQQEHYLGVLLLVALSLVIVVGLSVWIYRGTTLFRSVALAMICGGALGNLIDRAYHGYVIDFILFHVGRFSWYVFNVADVAVVVGVILLLVEDHLFHRNEQND